MKPLDPGNYDILVTYAGYDSAMVVKVVVPPGGRVTQNFTLSPNPAYMRNKKAFVITSFCKKLVDQDNLGRHVMTSEEMKISPAKGCGK